MKVAVHLVCWNGSKYISKLFASLRAQTYHDWEFFVLDNASDDDTIDQVNVHTTDFPVPVHVTRSASNTGFAGGHNTLFTQNCDTAQYVLLLNQDMQLNVDCIEKLVVHMDANTTVAAVSPRLMKWDFERDQLTECVDSLGLRVYKNRRVVEQYAGQSWTDISNLFDSNVIFVFGVSGALPLFRMTALKEISFADGTFFDEIYHAYKEDVDLAYRLRSAGYEAQVHLLAVAYHDRSAAGAISLDDASSVKNKKSQSEWVKYHSYKNHLMTLYKNEYWQNALLDFPWIMWYELKKFVWFLLFDRAVLKGFSEIVSQRKALTQKRRFIRTKRKLSWMDFRKVI